MDLNSYIFVDESEAKKEKAKVKAAKKSRWWQQKKQRGICYYCNENVGPNLLTMDHIVPISRGGKTTPGNIVPACEACNKKKGADTIVDQLL